MRQGVLHLQQTADLNTGIRNAANRELERARKSFELQLISTQDFERKQGELATAIRIANTDVPVLVTDPNGCGKKKSAGLIQAISNRADAAFVRVNMSALPTDLMKSVI